MEIQLLTEQEILLLKELRKRVSDLNLSSDIVQDKNLVRWLRARKENIPAAEEMLRKNHLWLKETDIEDIVNFTNPPGWGVTGLYPWNLCGFDKDNNPVLEISVGEWDVRKAVSSGQRSALLTYSLKLMELGARACATASLTKPWMGQFVAIYDFKNFSMLQGSSLDVLQLVMQLVHIFDNNYPEMLRKGFVLNAPWAFQMLWRIISPVMDERTRNKIGMLGSDVTIWRKEISTLVPLDQFSSKYGGEGEDKRKMEIAPDGSPRVLYQ